MKLVPKFTLIAAAVALASYASADAGNSPQSFPAVLAFNDAYTLFVGPLQSQAAFYKNLSTNLSNTSAITASRLVLGAVSPLSDGNFSPTETGTLFQFLKNLGSNNPYSIFVQPDAESINPKDWTNWANSSSTAIGSPSSTLLSNPNSPCGYQKHPYQPATDSQMTVPPLAVANELMMSVCWATLMNQALGAQVISGVAYDGQSSVMPTIAGNLSWFKQELNYYHNLDPNVPNLLGWLHGGITQNVDISFAEMYDLNKGSKNSFRYSELATESSYKSFNLAEEAICQNTPKNGFCNTSHSQIFPGIQYQKNVLDPKNGKWGLVGAEGGSIASCALNPTDFICNTYQANIDVTQPIEDQILQSYLYIYLWTADWTAQGSKDFTQLKNILGPVPTADPATGINYPQVVYLFSTQYFGPDLSAVAVPEAGSGCILDQVVPGSTCGIENGFGAWSTKSGLQSFKNLTHNFLYYVQNCKGGSKGDCASPADTDPTSYDKNSGYFNGNAGIYMYDFIPVAWYS